MRISLLMVALGLLVTSQASAQTQVQTQVQQIRPDLRMALGERATAGPSFEMSTASTNGGWAGPVALQSFRLRFLNGDHKVKTLVVSRSGTASDLRIGDNDGNDPYEGVARYLPLTAAHSVQTITARCFGRCLLPIASSPGQVFVLSGFSLQHSQTDHNMAEVGIIPHLRNGMVEVWFDRYHEQAAGFSSPVAPSAVTIQYALIPEAAVAFQSHCASAGGGNAGGCATSRAAEQKVVLQGFHCGYASGQLAHLLVLGVDPRNPTVAEFQDNDRSEGGVCSVLIAGLH